MSSISSCNPELNLNCKELPLILTSSRYAKPFSSEVPYIFDRFDFALPQIFYWNTQTSNLSYQQAAKLPHLGVSFWSSLAVALQLILLKILLRTLFLFLSQKSLSPEYLALALGWVPWFSFYSWFTLLFFLSFSDLYLLFCPPDFSNFLAWW